MMNRAFTKLGQSSGEIARMAALPNRVIVSQLPALAVRELEATASDGYAQDAPRDAQRSRGPVVSNGRGKTESYLGLIAVALLYDRLRGKTSGVCAWMRFPLRMLSLQQLERLAKVIAY